ncbi:hypothetical protein [Haloterrigena alkaliphila]|uniref:PH domain-containing protein n=1 Tax=Haloterrigena alkaliphila TaxID=2816475 RepID=A0A8A2VG76_9EURY|nr:hypothetical protein [Haloterrigena alkaliphila]QSX00522.1 hypothetical protein J0X25_06070 [Haloterrigena alkaliphila]
MLGTWSERVDELLYDGERERHRVEFDSATVVVTNQRVLTFTPDGDEANFRDVARPNVTRVSVETESAPARLVWASVLLGLGLGLVVLAQTFDLDGLLDDLAGSTETPAVADGALETAATVLTAVDLSILVAGIVLLVLAGVFVVRYARSRSRRLVLRVSGGDDLSLPVTDADIESGRTMELEEAISPGPAPAADDGEPADGNDPSSGSGAVDGGAVTRRSSDDTVPDDTVTDDTAGVDRDSSADRDSTTDSDESR